MLISNLKQLTHAQESVTLYSLLVVYLVLETIIKTGAPTALDCSSFISLVRSAIQCIFWYTRNIFRCYDWQPCAVFSFYLLNYTLYVKNNKQIKVADNQNYLLTDTNKVIDSGTSYEIFYFWQKIHFSVFKIKPHLFTVNILTYFFNYMYF